MSAGRGPQPRRGRRVLARLRATFTYYRRFVPFVRLLGRGEHRSVLTAGERLLAVEPRDALVLGTMAGSARELGRIEEARQLWLRVLEVEPDDFSALSALAATFVDAADHERAYPLVRRALAAAPAADEPVDELGLRLNRWLGLVLRRRGVGERYRRQHEERQERLARWIEWAREYVDWCEAVLGQPPETVH